jgi:methyl-accepting chemotaxis protein
MTQQNAALVEQSAAAAESLKEQAHRMTTVVAGFRTSSDFAIAPAAKPAPVAHKPVAVAKPVAAKPAAPKAAPVAVAAPAPSPAPAAVASGPSDDWESF